MRRLFFVFVTLGMIATALLSGAAVVAGRLLPGADLISYESWQTEGIRRADLYLVDVRHGTTVNLTRSPAFQAMTYHATWSPDGARLAYISLDDGINTIYLLDFATLHSERLLPPGVLNASPLYLRWSPDGRWLAACSTGLDASLIVFDMHAVPITFERYPIAISNQEDFVWSPDSTHLMISGDFDHRLWLVDYDAVQHMLETLTVSQSMYTGDQRPSWSPDGSQVAFFRRAYSFEYLFLMNADGTHQYPLLTGGVQAWTAPVWTPDGRTLLMNGRVEGSSGLIAVDVQTSAVTLLVPQVSHYSLAFSADGTRLLGNRYSSQSEGTQIVIMEPDGTPSQIIPTPGDDIRNPLWVPRGTFW
ncbi:MAG: hypothetical protein U0670_18950 [Anaerolineae bacterium]